MEEKKVMENTEVKDEEFDEVNDMEPKQEIQQVPATPAPVQQTIVTVDLKKVGRGIGRAAGYFLMAYGAAKLTIKIADIMMNRGRKAGMGGLNSDIDDDLNDENIVDGGTIE